MELKIISVLPFFWFHLIFHQPPGNKNKFRCWVHWLWCL